MLNIIGMPMKRNVCFPHLQPPLPFGPLPFGAAPPAPDARAPHPKPRPLEHVLVRDLRPWLRERARRFGEAYERLAADRRRISDSDGLDARLDTARRWPARPSLAVITPDDVDLLDERARACSSADAGTPAAPAHVMVAGWTRDIAVLLETMFASEPAVSVVILATHIGDPDEACAMLARWPHAFLVRGSAHVTSDLLRAGLLEARTVLLLGTPEAFAQNRQVAEVMLPGAKPMGKAIEGMLPADAAQALAVTKVSILRLRAELDRQERSKQQALADPLAVAASAGPAARATDPNVRVLAEVMETAAIPFLDQSGWWPLDSSLGAHIDSPAFAAGNIFADSMSFPLLAHLYFVPDMLNLLDALLLPSDGHAFLQLIEPPPELVGASFGELFERLLGFQRLPEVEGQHSAEEQSHEHFFRKSLPADAGEGRHSAEEQAGRRSGDSDRGWHFHASASEEALDSGMLAVGLYKRRSARHSYVYLVPRREEKVEAGDKVYVIARRQIDAIASEVAAAADALETDAELQASIGVGTWTAARAAVRDQAERAQAEVGGSELEMLRREVLAIRTDLCQLTNAVREAVMREVALPAAEAILQREPS
ncbi:hypothetical protein T492DRAFT_901667 [Pavlovales sp. CCMP2436]|nr:hypothetical protein T492DRAFT_901667 [Pavlovales sp. CCMP2436]